MKKTMLILFLLFLVSLLYSQKSIENGMTGLDSRNAINTNFDTLYNHKNAYINVIDYGAVADGVTNDAAAFTNAIIAAMGANKAVIIPEGTYRIASVIYIANSDSTKHKIDIRGIGNVILDGDGISDEIIDIQNRAFIAFPDYNLTSEITKGDITFTSDGYFAKGDIVKIYSDRPTDGDDGTEGEIVMIKGKSGDTYTINEYFHESYDTLMNIERIGNQSVFIENIKFIGDNTEHLSRPALMIDRSKNVTVQNCEISNAVRYALEITTSYNLDVNNNYITGATQNGEGYGVALNGCRNGRIAFNNITDCRHTITMNGGISCYNIDVLYNHTSTSDPYEGVIDCHAGSKNVKFIGNYLDGGGIWARGRNVIISDNVIRLNRAGYGVKASTNTVIGNTDYLIIRNNNIDYDTDEDVIGISVRFRSSNDTITNVVIDNNIINSNETAIYFPISSEHSGCYMENLIMNNNIINFNETDDLLNAAIAFLNWGVVYKNVRINNLTIKTESSIGIRTYGNAGGDKSGRLEITNTYIDSYNQSLLIDTVFCLWDEVVIKNNTLKSREGSTPNGIHATKVLIDNNIIEGYDSYSGLRIIDTDTLTWGKNTFYSTDGEIYKDIDVYYNIAQNNWMTNGDTIFYENDSYSSVVSMMFSGEIAPGGDDGDTLVLKIYARDDLGISSIMDGKFRMAFSRINYAQNTTKDVYFFCGYHVEDLSGIRSDTLFQSKAYMTDPVISIDDAGTDEYSYIYIVNTTSYDCKVDFIFREMRNVKKIEIQKQ